MFIDGTQLFFAVKESARKLDYRELFRIAHIHLNFDKVVLWTWYNPENTGQMRFLEFLKTLGVELEAYSCGVRKEEKDNFEVEIAYALGKVQGDAYVISDSKKLSMLSKGAVYFASDCQPGTTLAMDLDSIERKLFGLASEPSYFKSHDLF